MSETAVERRLRQLAIPESSPYMGARSVAAIDAGREAIALLVEWRDRARTDRDVAAYPWRDKVHALLARCEGES